MTRFSARMERIREELIRRAQMERRANADDTADAMERGQRQPEMQQRSEPVSETYTTRLAAMFSRPAATIFHRNEQQQQLAPDTMTEPVVESPKSPRPNSEWPTTQSRTQQSASSQAGIASNPEYPGQPQPAVLSGSSIGTTTGEAENTTQATSGRRRRKRSKAKTDPKRFLFCFPWAPSRRVRSSALYCFTSGLFLVLLLAVYLGLSTTQHIPNGELTIMLLLVILFSTVFFCYCIVRLCILLVRGDRSRSARHRHADGYSSAYSMPRRPIRVVLAQDEEDAGVESETAKLTPPAYGLWRESVRLDPNRLYWQRNEAAASSQASTTESSTGPRPPSYASDDGVSYIVEALPTSSHTSTAQQGLQRRESDTSPREPVVVSV